MTSDSTALRIFIGSGEATRIECLVLMHSLRSGSSRPLDIAVMNATRGVLERAGEERPLPLWPGWREAPTTTEFSYLRWLVPALSGHRGRALYLDSDMLCLADVALLFDQPLEGAQFLALPSELGTPGRPLWRTSVMPIDCGATHFDLEAIFDEAKRGLFHPGDFLQLAPNFLARHPYRIGRLDPAWNRLDDWDPATRLLHYTDLARQPWRVAGHPHGALWHRHLRAALAAGVVHDGDLAEARRQGALSASLVQSYEPQR